MARSFGLIGVLAIFFDARATAVALGWLSLLIGVFGIFTLNSSQTLLTNKIKGNLMDILHPMLGMIALSGLLVAVLLASRLPPIIKYWGNLQFAEHSEDLRPQLPRPLRLITENYNHIFEQPTLFFATCAYIYMAGQTDPLNVGLAWAYVGLRMLHTITQVTVNNVTMRVSFFATSSACLVAMIIREVFKLV